MRRRAHRLGNSSMVAAASGGTIEITFPDVAVFALDDFHTRRGFVGSTASRAYFGFRQGGTLYALDTLHEGSGADCRTWITALASATRGQVSLSSGARTGTEWATAVETALGVLGVTGVSRVGATVTITPATGYVAPAANTYDTSLRGRWGMQRDVFGGGSSSSSTGAMGGTGSVHLTSPNLTGRIIAIGMRATGSNNVRLGIANGPAYSTTPTAFSGGLEGVSTNNSGFRLYPLPEPMAMTALQNKWISFRGVSGGDPALVYRNFTDTPQGNGDLGAAEQLLFSTTTSNPATAIYTAGAYTHGAEAGPYSINAFVFFIYEVAVAGTYPGDGGLVTAIGTHQDATTGTPTATVATTMDEETFGMRHVIPWTCNATAVDIAVVARSASEDLSVALYRFLDTDAPTATSNPLLYGGGLYGVTGTGYQRHTFASPVALTAGWTVDVHFCAGNLDGTTPTTTISVAYDANPGGDDYWSTAWPDSDGRAWCDMIPAGGGGLGVLTEYRTLAPDGNMPMGDPTPTWPDPFDADATDDHSTENLLRHRLYVSRTGITAVES